jgi:uncharacterized protein (TIGR03663 family)
VSTGSTKSSSRKGARAGGEVETSNLSFPGTGQPEGASAAEMYARTWQLASLFVLVLAAFVRLYALELNPLHHDEGVNGFFLINLINNGVYKYDPANYHGPTLYYFALVMAKFLKAFGFALSTYGIRLVPVMFGTGSVWLILCLRRRIGSTGALAGALLVALSPGAVYMSRYFIHESLFVFFTLGIVVAWLQYYDTANPIYLLLAAISAALLFATKETAMISAGVLLIALVLSGLYVRLRKNSTVELRIENQRRQNKKRARHIQTESPDAPFERFGGTGNVGIWALAAILLFVCVYILFYSSFFTHQQGLNDSLKTFQIWARTGRKDHVHEWHTYLSWLSAEEAMLLLLGAAGTVMALWRARGRFALFAALWACGIIAAYSLIPYKTPWLTLNFIIPLAIIGGYGVDVMYRMAAEEWALRALVMTILTAALVFAGYQMFQLNFRHYDDEQYIYPYAHTVREFLPLVERINRFAVHAQTGRQTAISITSPDYWPLPWYLRDYTRVGYPGRIEVSDEALVIGSEAQETELEAVLGNRYQRIDSYQLRPGVTLVLYVRRDLVER